jgi:RNA polymerase sigma-70 factor (ECF subfamily)
MSRLFRGRKLLQQSLAQFAVEQGYVKGAGSPAPAPIALDDYRAKKTRS